MGCLQNKVFILSIKSALLLTLCLIIYFVNLPGIKAADDRVYIIDVTTPTELVKATKEILSEDIFGNREVVLLLVKQTEVFSALPQFAGLDREELLTYAESEMLKLIRQNPGDARLHTLLTNFYQETGQTDKARKEFFIVRELSPDKPVTILYQGLTELGVKDYESAHAFFC